MDKILIIITVAILAESIWETLKMLWQDGKISIDRIGALIIGLLIGIAAQIDIFAMQGITFIIPGIGCVFTGILISRGANFMHDLFSKLGKE